MNTRWLAVAATLALGCGGERSATTAAHLPAGVVARVGGEPVETALVAAVARSNGKDAHAALEAIVDDVTLAQSEIRVRPLQASWSTVRVLATTLVARLDAEARALGPARAQELASVSVVHAVVLRDPRVPDARAVALAQSLARSVAVATDPDDFESRARAVGDARTRIVVERLPAFDASGEAADGARFDPAFVAAALGLKKVGETTSVVETPFGWHVIRLVGRKSPDPDRLEETRSRLQDAVVAMRTLERMRAILSRRRGGSRVDVAESADALMVRAVEAEPP